MAAKLPVVWWADLVRPIDPQADQPADAAGGPVRLAGAANEVQIFQFAVEKRAGRIESIRVEGAGVEAALHQTVAVPLRLAIAATRSRLSPGSRRSCRAASG
jgi:hypothetical protein